jgi:uncharacterized protein
MTTRAPQGKLAITFAAGVLFAIGLAVSGMTNARNVTAFLDVTGDWDPSLAMVMGGAIGMHAICRKLLAARTQTWSGGPLPTLPQQPIDKQLLLGAALFGIGWGAAGYCPGPALVALGAHTPNVAVFVATMLIGSAVTAYVMRYRSAPPAPTGSPTDIAQDG